MTLTQSFSSLVGALDRGVGQAWRYTGGDLQRECAGRRGWRCVATYARYVAAFASLLGVALWRHETQRVGVAAWCDATRHAFRVWGQGLGMMALAGGVLALVDGSFEGTAGLALGAAYGVALSGSVAVGLGVQAWFPSGKMSAPLPLPLRLRAAAAMAACVLLMMGQVLPVAARLLTGTWTYAPIGLDAFQRTIVENLPLSTTFIARGELHLALIVLPALTLPFAMGAITLCAPFVGHGIEHRRPLPNVRTGLTLALLTSAQSVLLIIVGGLTFAARWPVAALVGQFLMVTATGALAIRGLLAATSAARSEVV